MLRFTSLVPPSIVLARLRNIPRTSCGNDASYDAGPRVLPPRTSKVGPQTPSVAARLDRLPITRSHRLFAMIVGIGAFFDLFDVFLSGVLSTALTRSFNVDRGVLPVILGSGFLGMFFGALGELAEFDCRSARNPLEGWQPCQQGCGLGVEM